MLWKPHPRGLRVTPYYLETEEEQQTGPKGGRGHWWEWPGGRRSLRWRGEALERGWLLVVVRVPGAGAEWAWSERACAVHWTRRAKETR